MRMRILLVLAALIGAVGLVATAAGVAVAANPPALNGEQLLSVTATNDYSNCASAPGQVVPFGVASGVVTNDSPATAPYPGTFAASGSATLDPTTNKVTALSGTFSIHDTTDSTDISGTISLNGSAGSYAACDASGAFLTYTATITTPSTTCTDTGTAFIDTNDASYFALYSFHSTALTCGPPPPPPPKELLGQTSDQLKLLLQQQQQSMKAAEQAKIEDATAKLDQAEASNAWITASKLQAKTGSTVFDLIQKAMIDTFAAAKLEKMVAVASQLADAQKQMKDATVTITGVALEEAQAMLPTVSADVAAEALKNIKIAMALEQKALEIKAGQTDAISSLNSQMQLLQNSWAESQKALLKMEA